MLHLIFLLLHADQTEKTQRYSEIDCTLLPRYAVAMAVQAVSKYYG